MPPLHRHQLVRLTRDGWQRLRDRPWDATAAACLAHWASHELPLVVTRQRPGAHAADGIAMGLPAPARWERRRLALVVPPRDIAGFDEFPRAEQVGALLAAPARADWQHLCTGLAARGILARVHGSHGWQRLTGLDHLRPGSDIDLCLRVSHAHQADDAVALVQRFPLAEPRLDGELVFPDGDAVAWREWLAWRAGRSRTVLVKRLDGCALWRPAGRRVGPVGIEVDGMSTPGRPKCEFRSAQHGGCLMSTPGRPKCEFRSAQHGGCLMSTHGRAEALVPERAARRVVR